MSPTNIQLNTIESALDDIRQGKVLIVVDNEDRENEGDFICAAESITPEIINFMATHGRGLICAPIDEQRADELNLDLMVSSNTAYHETAFTVSIDLIGHGCTTGISAHDRASCIKALTDPNAKSTDFARPGHIFPLRAKSGGVLRRNGHTEAAVDLAKLAGLYPAGVLVEILNQDGSMARLSELIEIAKLHQLKIITIQDLVAYRLKTERLVERIFERDIQTPCGDFRAMVYRQANGDEHLAVVKGYFNGDEIVPVRVHSSSESVDIYSVLFKGYAREIEKTMEYMQKQGKGVFLNLFHGEKKLTLLETLMHQEKPKTNSVEFNENQKDIGVGAQILKDLGIHKIRLITSQPKRRVGLKAFDLEIVDHMDPSLLL
ncbi:MAG: 3,4-dihydroxy-2-butanone-4-phosphate synthase [Saprospiraceae bacterium]|nr:3,4-dihydroxy-2-butanone-4-phosphate synthase [Saprospiraceae bacterium]